MSENELDLHDEIQGIGKNIPHIGSSK